MGGAGDVDSIPGLGRSHEVENDGPLQCSCLETPGTEEPTVHGVAESDMPEHARAHAHTHVVSYLCFGLVVSVRSRTALGETSTFRRPQI